MRVHYCEKRTGLAVTVTATETEDWASRPGSSWPGSVASGSTVVVTLDASGDLMDYNGPENLPAHELDALLSDCLKEASEQRWRRKAKRENLAHFAGLVAEGGALNGH